jgi:predicted nucleic acid-binding protein
MRRVFLDTVGLIALWEESDQWHVAAEQALSALSIPAAQLVTTSLILLECGNAAARKPYRMDVEQLRRRMLFDQTLVEATVEEIAQAWRDYAARSTGDAGIVDHVSFIVMRRLGIAEAFTNDRHFRAAGFRTLF